MSIPRRKVSRFPAFETFSGWARIMGVSPYKCKKVLDAVGVQPRFYGKMRVVTLASIRQQMPDLWESMRLRKQLGEEEEEDEAA